MSDPAKVEKNPTRPGLWWGWWKPAKAWHVARVHDDLERVSLVGTDSTLEVARPHWGGWLLLESPPPLSGPPEEGWLVQPTRRGLWWLRAPDGKAEKVEVRLTANGWKVFYSDGEEHFLCRTPGEWCEA